MIRSRRRYLPDALFVIFNQATAYAEAFDSDVCASVKGELDEAVAFRQVYCK